ncbi:MAG TPA: polysaccharide biosynthesis tyrosine autokinase [Acetobacteraceae bacterium]|nr:polysaccharide biosynthesis tyrosine autokinase [Acetobacteraceae bacterium]
MTAETDVGAARIIDVSGSPVRPSSIQTLQVMRRHWRLIAAVAVAGALAALLLCKLLTPLYASRVTILIDPRAPQRTATSIDPLSFLPPSEESVRKNEIAIIRSRGLADTVIKNLRLDEDPEFNPALRRPSFLRRAAEAGKNALTIVEGWIGWTRSKPPQLVDGHGRVIDTFLSLLGATATDASRVIDIRFYAEQPERAAQIANAIAQRFIQDRGDQELNRAQMATESLESEISTLNLKIRDTEHKVERMRTEHGVLPAADLKVITEQLSDLNKQMVSSASDRAAAKAKLDAVQAAIASDQIDSLGGILNSLLIQKLEEQVARTAADIAGMSAVFGDKYPKVIQAKAALTGLRSQVMAEATKIAASYRSDLAAAQAKETMLRGMIETAQNELAKANVSEVDVRALEREVDSSKALLSQLVLRLNDTRAQMNRSGPGARIISPATEPRFPSFPPTFPIVAVAFILSATGGTIFAGLLARRDRSIRSTMQLRQMTALRVCGATPLIDHISRTPLLPANRMLSRQSPMFIENLRSIWLQIDHARHDNDRTVLITSAIPGEGKSSTATSLARLLALDGRSVLIVDADLRYPAVHRIFGLRQSPGLAEVIMDGTEPAVAIQRDPASGAAVIAAGSASESPAQILGSPRVSETLARLSRQFDTVIIDAPPILPVPDAALLALQADMTLMVVRWGSTKATTVTMALQRLRSLNIAVSGVIMTMVDQRSYVQDDDPDSDIFSRAAMKYYAN